jgi:hypothetical protein
MHPFQFRLAVIYVFLGSVAVLSLEHIWSIQTNPFVSYLGEGRWYFLAIDVGAIAASGLIARKLMLRVRAGPEFVEMITWAVLFAYLGIDALLAVLTMSWSGILAPQDAYISLLAVGSLIILRTSVFVDGYALEL